LPQKKKDISSPENITLLHTEREINEKPAEKRMLQLLNIKAIKTTTRQIEIV
jgi:hypothetical protein